MDAFSNVKVPITPCGRTRLLELSSRYHGIRRSRTALRGKSVATYPCPRLGPNNASTSNKAAAGADMELCAHRERYDPEQHRRDLPSCGLRAAHSVHARGTHGGLNRWRRTR